MVGLVLDGKGIEDWDSSLMGSGGQEREMPMTLA
jgi:hypothetical protein